MSADTTLKDSVLEAVQSFRILRNDFHDPKQNREDMANIMYGTIAWCVFYAIVRKYPKGKPIINGKEATFV